MGKAKKGRAGCGCLLFVLVSCMVLAGVLVHPFSLRLMAGRFRYEDKSVPCDAVFVPRFAEDKNGEVYNGAFREYWAGNARAIWVEDDRVFGFTMKDIVGRMAKERGIKDDAIHALNVEGDDDVARAARVRSALARQGIKRVIVVVPGYASKRYHLLYGSSQEGNSLLFLVKPVDVSYFRTDKWWSDDVSRALVGREFCRIGSMYVKRFGHGKREDTPSP
ncbi:MAG: hypothetical protein ABSC19_13830 [Syntrophorhabdales bacterium]